MVGIGPTLLKATIRMEVRRFHIRVLNPAPTPPPSAPTTGTPTRFVPPVKTPTKVSYARKTVQQVTKKREHSTTRAQHVPAEPITLYGTSTNANRGPIAPPASTSLRTAQVPLTVYAHPAALEHIPPAPTHSPAPLGPIA